MDSPDTLTRYPFIHYRRAGMTQRKMLTLLTLGGLSLVGGVSFVTFNINFGHQNGAASTDPFKRTAEATFPPQGSKVPQTVFLRGHAFNVAHTEDLRVEVKHKLKDGRTQYVYKHMKFGEGDEIYRDDHHFGLVGKDVGEKFWVQFVIAKSGSNLTEDIYYTPQPVERLGERTFYIRRACTAAEKLTPKTWREEMIRKGEIA